MSARYLTKSLFKTATECPAKLYYSGKDEFANTLDDNEFLQSLAEGGFQVGELAKLMFLGGEQVTVSGHAAQLEKTRDLLNRDDAVIFEGALAHEKLFVRVDVLSRKGKLIDLIEVKSKTFDPEDEHFFKTARGKFNSKIFPYLLDIAFQTHVARLALPEAEVRPFLMLPNKAQAATVSGMNQKFVIKRKPGKADGQKTIFCEPIEGLRLTDLGAPMLMLIDVQEYVDEILTMVHEFPGAVGSLADLSKVWSEFYARDEQIFPPIGGQCKKCEFRPSQASKRRSGLNQCWSKVLDLTEAQLQKPLVLDLWNGRNVANWIQQKTYLMEQLTAEQIGLPMTEAEAEAETGLTTARRQWMAISRAGLNQQGYFFDAKLVKVEMSKWKYPLNFIDFETSTTVLPFHKGARPNELVAFQFSHHILYEDGTLVHANEFLSTEPGHHQNSDFLRALKRALAVNDGTVMTWSPYENTVLNTIIRQIEFMNDAPADSTELVEFAKTLTVLKAGRDLVRRGDREMFDLCKLSEKVFFHQYTGGSNSIKKVLPAMLQASDLLRETYSRSTYGGGQLNSKNFIESIAWWQAAEDGLPLDPYQLLPPVFSDLDLPIDDEGDADQTRLNQGGAAVMAYARLQFESIERDERARWETALKKYCELDTLAMVMVVQGWRAWATTQV
jgi:hypothetical protein